MFTTGKPEQMLKMIASLHPAGRIGQPDDISPIVSMIASPDARWLNGQNIMVNGVRACEHEFLMRRARLMQIVGLRGIGTLALGLSRVGHGGGTGTGAIQEVMDCWKALQVGSCRGPLINMARRFAKCLQILYRQILIRVCSVCSSDP